MYYQEDDPKNILAEKIIKKFWCGNPEQRESDLHLLGQKRENLDKKEERLREEIARWRIDDDYRDLSAESVRVLASFRGVWESADGTSYRVWGKKTPSIWDGIDIWKKEEQKPFKPGYWEVVKIHLEDIENDSLGLNSSKGNTTFKVEGVAGGLPPYKYNGVPQEKEESEKSEKYKPTVKDFYENVVYPTLNALNALLRHCCRYPEQEVDPGVKEAVADGFRFFTDVIFTTKPEIDENKLSHLIFSTWLGILDTFGYDLLDFAFQTFPEISGRFQEKLRYICEQFDPIDQANHCDDEYLRDCIYDTYSYYYDEQK